jgi:hypothetical protein
MKSLITLLLLACALSTAAAQDKTLTEQQLRLRAVYADGFSELAPRMVGVWGTTYNILSDYGTFLAMDGTIHVGEDSTEYLVVKSPFLSSGLGLMGRTESGKWLLLYTSSPSSSYYQLFEFSAARDWAAGRYWIYLKTESPTGNGYFMRGYRFADLAAEPSAKSAVDVSDITLEEQYAQHISSERDAPKQAMAELSAMTAELEARAR